VQRLSGCLFCVGAHYTATAVRVADGCISELRFAQSSVRPTKSKFRGRPPLAASHTSWQRWLASGGAA
jgi:hypothetical protein